VGRTFIPIPDFPLKGIIHHLTAECGGNVDDRGIVAITADRTYSDLAYYAAKNIADLDENTYFYCANAGDMWVCYDFKDRRVSLTDYSIKAYSGGANNILKSWVIEVSDDGSSWTEADRRENCDDLCAQNVVRLFPVRKPSTGRYVRLHQIGLNSSGSFHTVISGFELFGALRS
jgi:hypothetical protein